MTQPITTQGYDSVLRRLESLVAERRLVAEEISEARSKGDLSENAEYHAAKAKQELLERKIAELNHIITEAEVVDVASIESDTVGFGATVVLVEKESNKQYVYKIVGPFEADVSNGLISIEANLSRELLGKRAGDVVYVEVPSGERIYEIKSVEYK